MLEFSEINLILFLPALLVFLALVLHCYLYRGGRLTLTFFGSVFLHALLKELTHIYVEHKFAFALRPYRVLGETIQIFRLPLVIYMGWAITFYLGWYLAERILKRIGRFSDRIFPTIVWAILISGAISYCVEATAIKAGWWLWTFPDRRLGSFLVTPFSALQAWPSQTSLFLLIFFLFECSRYRNQWWRVFLFTLIVRVAQAAIIIHSFINLGQNNPVIKICDSIIILLPILLIFFSSLQLQFTRLYSINLKRNVFFYDMLAFLALALILFTCIIMDIIVLKKPELLISTLPLILLIIFSIKKIPLLLIFIVVAFSLILGDKRLYILYIPTIVFFAFLSYIGLMRRFKYAKK